MYVPVLVMYNMSKISPVTFNKVTGYTLVMMIVVNLLSTLLITYKLWLFNFFL